MHITEIPKNSEITIVASINTNYIEFSSKVVETKDQAVIVEVITTEDGKTVGLESDKLNVDVSYIEQEEKSPFIWKGVKSKFIKIGKKTYHVLWQTKDGIRQNRRTAFRLFIGEEAQLKVLSKSIDEAVTLKDISTTGFAFTCNADLEVNKSCTILCSVDNSKLVLSGMIIRKQNLENGNIVYGCKLNRFSKELEKFIAKKQREALSRKTGR